MFCARVSYNGRLIMREIKLASMAHAIRLNTMEWPSTISITMMKAVSGAWVTAARKPAMPMAIIAGPRSAPASRAIPSPMPAPMDSEGAKMPPGTPHQAVIQVAMNLSSVYRGLSSSWPASICLTASEPAPKVTPPVTKPITATTSPPTAANRTGQRARQ
ncbi:hypothetical protein D3C85_1346560 [compost metagenome]